MFLKTVVSLLALSIVATSGYVQTAVAQPAPSYAQANPNASMLTAVPDMGAMLTSFLGTANNPTTGDTPDVLIQRAQKAYSEKRFKDAMTSLQLAQDAVRRQHMDYYARLLPPASGGGWTLDAAKPEDTICLGEQIFGGGVALSRGYTNNGQKVKITFVTDAPIMSFIVPLLQSFAPLIAKGDLAQGTIKGYPSIYFENNGNAVQGMQPAVASGKQPAVHVLTVLMGDVIVTLSSETLGREFLTQFANVVDYDKLKVGQ